MISVLVDKFNVYAVNMVCQSLLTPYIYNATSGIVVDIGERIEIVTIVDGMHSYLSAVYAIDVNLFYYNCYDYSYNNNCHYYNN